MNFLIKIYKAQRKDFNNKNMFLTCTLPLLFVLCIGKVFSMDMKTYKTKLNPNNKQRTQLFKNAGVARFAYNLALEIEEDKYKSENRFLLDGEIRKIVTQRKKGDLAWLYDYDCNIVKQAIKDAVFAYRMFFKKITNRPKFKSRKNSRISFYANNESVWFKNGYVKIPKMKPIKLYEKDYVPENVTYYNPRITFDGIDWWISVVVSDEFEKFALTSQNLAVDVGIKVLATCSDGKVYSNITNTRKFKKLEKAKKMLQRAVSRKYEQNKDGNNYIKTKNIIKLEKRIRKKQIKQNNIKTDYYHKITTEMVRTKPFQIIHETLNIKGMMKNRSVSTALKSASLFYFLNMLDNKAEKYGIEVIRADRFFPSSKRCSNCGNIKHDLKLKDRVYKCEHCGLELDRDYNASLNLQQYPRFEGNLSLWRAKQTQVANAKGGSMKKEFHIEQSYKLEKTDKGEPQHRRMLI